MARYGIATQHGWLSGEFRTKKAAQAALAEEVRASAKECRKRRGCSVIGSARTGDVQILIGGRQSHSLWQRYVIRRK